MLRLTAELPRTISLYRPTEEQVASAVASRIVGQGQVQAVGDGTGFIVTASLDVLNAREHHENAANALLSAIEGSGLYATRLIATRLGTRLAEGALTGLAGGLGIGTQTRSDLAPWVALGSAVLGGLFGQWCEKELALFEWQRTHLGNWYEVPQAQGSSPAPQFGWA